MKRPADLAGRCPRCYYPLVPRPDTADDLCCLRCIRHDAGLCSDCGRASITGKRRRCRECKRRNNKAWNETRVRDTAAQRLRNRRRYREDGDYRERRLNNKRKWAKANPERHLAQRQQSDRRHQRHIDAYQKQYREDNRERRRVQARERERRLHPFVPPSCTRCGRGIHYERPTGMKRTGRLPWVCDGCCGQSDISRRKRLGLTYPAIPHTVLQNCWKWRYAVADLTFSVI